MRAELANFTHQSAEIETRVIRYALFVATLVIAIILAVQSLSMILS